MARRQSGRPQRIDTTAIIVAAITALSAAIVGYWQFVWKPSQIQPSSTPQQVQYVGRVIDSNTGVPIRGAKVSFEFQGAPPIAYTDTEGVYRFRVSFIGSALLARVRVEAIGYQNYDRNIELSAEKISLEDIRLIIAPLVSATATATAHAITALTNTPQPLPSPTPFPTSASLRSVSVIIAHFAGCDHYEETLKTQLGSQIAAEASQRPQAGVQEIKIEIITEAPTTSAQASKIGGGADVMIWGTCSSPPVVNFQSRIRTGPWEVYEPQTITFTDTLDASLGRKTGLGLARYVQRDFSSAAAWFRLATREADQPAASVLALLLGNSVFFQNPSEPDEAIAVYQAAVPHGGELAVHILNNLGVALFAKGMGPGTLGPARAVLTQAITLRPDEPLFHFNRAYAWANGLDSDPKQATADCQALQQKSARMSNPQSIAAGYACKADDLLRNFVPGDAAKEVEIRQVLNAIPITDWPLPYFLRGVINQRTGFEAEATKQFACYLILIRNEVKLPIELERINLALEYMRNKHESLDRLCP